MNPHFFSSFQGNGSSLQLLHASWLSILQVDSCNVGHGVQTHLKHWVESLSWPADLAKDQMWLEYADALTAFEGNPCNSGHVNCQNRFN
jgi:hypothetical protein